MPLFSKQQVEFLEKQPVARLATFLAYEPPHLVPVCYAFDGENFYIGTGISSRKVKNLRADSRAALLIDTYVEEWGQLKSILVQGEAEILETGVEFEKAREMLHKKYPQYASMPITEGEDVIIKIVPKKVTVRGLK